MSTEKTFRLFPLLPLELRQQIWCQALLAPAVWFATFSEEPDRDINARNKEIMDQLAADESLTG
jgi:2EXR family protein